MTDYFDSRTAFYGGKYRARPVLGGVWAAAAVAAFDALPPFPFDAQMAAAFERGHARDGERMLVHGGTSGIGTMAVLLGRLFGLEVIVTCGGAAKCARALELGAAHAIDYREQDFVAEVARITGGEGVHLVLDMVSGDYVARNLKCLAEDGRHVTIAVQGGLYATLNMAEIMRRRLTLSGSTLRPRSNQFKALLAQEIAQNAWPLVAEGLLRPVMDRSFPLAEAAAAHARMEAGEHVGKIVLEVG